MFKHSITQPQRQTLATAAGGALGAFVATLVGIPVGLLLLLAAGALAYAFRWRIVIVRKSQDAETIDV